SIAGVILPIASRAAPLSRRVERARAVRCDRTPSAPLPSGKAHGAAVAPLRADEAHQHDENDGHVPELTLFYRCHAASGVADVLRKSGHVSGRIEASARLLRDPTQRRLVHRRIEILAVAGAGAHIRVVG